MSYLTSTPISVTNPFFEEFYPDYVAYCKQAGVGRIWLCVSRPTAPENEKQHSIAMLEKYVPLLKAEGFEVGSWCSALGHGGTCGHEEAAMGFTLMRSLEGENSGANYCPLGETFQAACCDWVGRLAATGVSIIQLDDDYRMSFRSGGRYCCCEEHVKLTEEKTGEPFDAARMKEALLTGGPNKWRDAWLYAQGFGLKELARKLREAVDKVDPAVRLTACSVLSTWDVDGVDTITLAKTFAGNTRPLARLIGAPYWAALRNYDEAGLAVVSEYERLQHSWAAGSGVEIYGEGDPCPRVRYTVPAVYLDSMDQIWRAAGTCDGIQKYFFNYSPAPGYDTCYFDLHMKHLPLYDTIEKTFGGKTPVGVQLFEPMNTYALATDPGVPEARCIPASIRFATDNSLPIRYDAGEDAAVIFGDAAECAGEEQFKHGAILDAAAAAILTRRGFDVGLAAAGDRVRAEHEDFVGGWQHIRLIGGAWRALQPVQEADVLSVLQGGTADGCPCAYRYENSKGQRFLVYAFIARESLQKLDGCGVMRGIGRAAQLRSQLAWLAGHEPDAICDGAPDLYIMVKKGKDGLSVGLWNFGVDTVDAPTVHLGADWDTIECTHGTAVLDGRTVRCETLTPFTACFFTVKNK